MKRKELVANENLNNNDNNVNLVIVVVEILVSIIYLFEEVFTMGALNHFVDPGFGLRKLHIRHSFLMKKAQITVKC